MNKSNEEQRTYKRFSANAGCWALLENNDRIAIKNISLFGACLVVPQSYDKEVSCRITICSDTKGNIKLTGSVIWSFPMGPEDSEEGRTLLYETGFKFVEMDDTQKKALQVFIDGLD